jgi:hypothetical protein
MSAKWASKEVDAYFAVQSQSCLILYESSKEILTDKYPLVFLLMFLFLGKRYSEQDLVDSAITKLESREAKEWSLVTLPG